MTPPLSDPLEVARRRALLARPHMRPLARFAQRLRDDLGRDVPDADPCDGGTGATILLLLERPGRGVGAQGFVSRDNATPTARNLRRLSEAALLPRAATLVWNIVPWRDDGAVRDLPPRAAEIAAGAALLPPLLDLLPNLRAVILAGRIAASAAHTIAAHRPAVTLLRMPHPSPTILCTSPAVGERIAACLSEAARLMLPPDGNLPEPPRWNGWNHLTGAPHVGTR
jgi:hypothetical protein